MKYGIGWLLSLFMEPFKPEQHPLDNTRIQPLGVHFCTGLYWQPWPQENVDNYGWRAFPAGWTAPPGEEFVAMSRDDLRLTVKRAGEVATLELTRRSTGALLLQFHVHVTSIGCEPYLRWMP